MIIFTLPAGNSRRQRRLKRTGAFAPVLTGAWGRLATNKRASVYTEALLATTFPTVLGVLLNFSFNQSNKFAGTHIKCIGDFPKSFKICLFITVLNHRQVCAGNSRESAQNILGYTFLVAKIAYRPPNRIIVELHRLTPLSQQIVYEKTEK